MTLEEIYEYIEPLLHDDQMATQEASLILHFLDGSVEVVKKDEGDSARRTMSYIKSPLRIYVHCPNAECDCHRAALTFLHSWGIEPSFEYDGDHYLEFVVPPGWSVADLKRFTDALSLNLTVRDEGE